MDFIDLRAQYEQIGEEIEAQVLSVLRSGRYILGPQGEQLEDSLAKFVGIEHAVACSSGTDALVLALMTYGVRPGDLVVTSPFTFYATAEAISLLGAVPVFADIDASTFNVSIDAFRNAVASALPSGRLAGAIGVDMFGLPAPYASLRAELPDNCFLIEDAAQSLGATLDGKVAGGLADMGCTSFFPSKPLGGYGDGGAVFTRSADQAETLRSLRMHGQGVQRYEHVAVGMNGRLDEVQAAILNVKLGVFERELEQRVAVAGWYLDELAKHQIPVTAPAISTSGRSAWAQFSVLAESTEARDQFVSRMADRGVPTAIHYPVPLHRQPVYEHLGYGQGSFPVAEDVCSRVFSIPMHPYLTHDAVKTVVRAML